MATNAAIPTTIEEMKRSSFPLFRLLSRHAIFNNQVKFGFLMYRVYRPFYECFFRSYLLLQSEPFLVEETGFLLDKGRYGFDDGGMLE